MSVERTLFAFGGIMVMLTSLLALFHHPNWTWLTLFIGFNCFQSSFTCFCPPSCLMKKFVMKTEAELALGQWIMYGVMPDRSLDRSRFAAARVMVACNRAGIRPGF